MANLRKNRCMRARVGAYYFDSMVVDAHPKTIPYSNYLRRFNVQFPRKHGYRNDAFLMEKTAEFFLVRSYGEWRHGIGGRGKRAGRVA
jgi:hypothetical protein